MVTSAYVDTYGEDRVSLDSYEYYDNYKFIRCDRTADIPLIDGALIAAPISALDQLDTQQYVRLVAISNRPEQIEPYKTKTYINPIRHKGEKNLPGNLCNKRPMQLVHTKPDKGEYYTADNVDGYLIMSYVRVILQFDFSDLNDMIAMDATTTT